MTTLLSRCDRTGRLKYLVMDVIATQVKLHPQEYRGWFSAHP